MSAPEMTAGEAGQRHLAWLLLSEEAAGNSGPGPMADAFNKSCFKLTARLSPVIGDLGVHLVFFRALKITQAGFPFLSADPDVGQRECLKGLRVSLEGQDSATVMEALTSLLANFLALLEELLGRDLVNVFVREEWPEVEFPY